LSVPEPAAHCVELLYPVYGMLNYDHPLRNPLVVPPFLPVELSLSPLLNWKNRPYGRKVLLDSQITKIKMILNICRCSGMLILEDGCTLMLLFCYPNSFIEEDSPS